MKNENNKTNKEEHSIDNLIFGLLIAVMFIVVFNVVLIGQVKSDGSDSQNFVTGAAVANVNNIDVSPKGTPRIYGAELGVSYDDISASNVQKAESTISKLGSLDVNIKLTETELARYISIAGKISCEYCCGAESIIMSDGRAACGCSHSYAMRGVAKYLIKNHGNEFSDDEILEELGKWKTLFFPDKLAQKAAILNAMGVELNYINLASNKYRDIEKTTNIQLPQSNTMVGGC